MADSIPTYDLTLVRGDTYERRTFVMEYSDGSHADFTGYTVLAQARPSANAPRLLIEFASGVDENGDPYIEASSADTTAIGPISKGVWDLQMTSPAGRTRTYLAGDVTIIQDVSH
jgi:hypothetical protein